VALVHHPVYDRNHRVVTSAVTNLDIHDIARSTATYGLAGYHVVTPVAAQREKVERILAVWNDGMVQSGADNRIDALARVRTAASIAEITAAIAEAHGRAPRVVATSARPANDQSVDRGVGFAALRASAMAETDRPLLLLFGTGWGLTDDVIADAEQVLLPICGMPTFNHLSVRSAVAVILDRLFGMREAART
jgi:hypothetical protein